MSRFVKDVLWQAHIQQRVWVALLVVVDPLVGLKAHVLIESDGLGVLLVDGDLADAVVLDAVLQKLPAKSPAALQCKDISDQKSG